ncbi:uncharacterized protein LOC111083138 [Limulus polyphemus]|uniref:Uncharacterized protein LOC111083138 n=1 Tax=Limulus polyphemus TaxID=6850 RepID=A0ABM1RUS1_LIMPO|nr:uncharacterized protein LOC111083138 [Limulus polyphemus]
MKMLGHEGQIIDVLKMDVEGSELDALEQMVDSRVLKNVNHLCIEIHLIASYFDRTLNTLQRLENEDNFQFFSSRPNPIVAPMAVPGRYKTEYFLYELAWFKRRT